MSGLNLTQVYAAKPITTNSSTDLMYFETGGLDAAMHYSDFAAQFPGKTGTGASGTWGINISGNAATATSASSASSVPVGGITGLGTGVATALAVNLGSAGAFVTFNGAGGTPSSMTATNLTGTAAGLTAGTASAVAVGGITGLGTGVATALAVNIGSAGAFVTFNGAGGTPSSLTLTNATGLPLGGGGTGASTAATAFANIAAGMFSLTYTASAVNSFSFENNTTGSKPSLNAVGTDSNITLQLGGKGTGGATVQGTSTNDDATAGFVGQFISSVIVSGSGVSLTNNMAADITSISLTAGDWDVFGNFGTAVAGSTVITLAVGWMSTTSATLPTSPNNGSYAILQGVTLAAGSNYIASVGTIRLSLSATTTVYLSCLVSFSVSTATGIGFIGARRVR